MSNPNDIITYYNLTQCADGDTGKRFIYFRSTDVEQKNYTRLLWGVPDEWLYFLSLGKQIRVIDKSSNGSGKIERIFVPTFNDSLNWLYFGSLPHDKKLSAHFNLATHVFCENRFLHHKFLFWKDYITQPINILAETIHCDKEPNPL